MPTTYTHDVFGKMVYQKLPENLKEIVEEHMNAYRIGQHGPDILFYYHPMKRNTVNGQGYDLHDKPADLFFRHAAQPRFFENAKNTVRKPGMKRHWHMYLDLSAIICWTVRVIPILQNTWRRPGQGMMRSKLSWIVI